MYISTLFHFTYISTSQWISDPKGFVDTTCISCYIFFKRLKFEVFQLEKTALKSLHEGKYRQSENEEFEALTQPAFTCSKLTIETLEQGVKYVQS